MCLMSASLAVPLVGVMAEASLTDDCGPGISYTCVCGRGGVSQTLFI